MGALKTGFMEILLRLQLVELTKRTMRDKIGGIASAMRFQIGGLLCIPATDPAMHQKMRRLAGNQHKNIIVAIGRANKELVVVLAACAHLYSIAQVAALFKGIDGCRPMNYSTQAFRL